MKLAFELGLNALVASSATETPIARVNAMASFLCARNDVFITDRIQKSPGVYMLYDENNVLYVGQSENVEIRIRSHTNISFAGVLVAYTEPHNLLAVEAMAIGLLRPIFNHKTSARYEPITCEVTQCQESAQ